MKRGKKNGEKLLKNGEKGLKNTSFCIITRPARRNLIRLGKNSHRGRGGGE